MDFRCLKCGAMLSGPPAPGMPFNCNYCGAPQPPVGGPAASTYGAPQNPYGAPPSPYGAPQNPYGPGPSPYGAAPPPVMQLQGPGATMQPGARVGVIVGLAVAVVLMGATGAVFSFRSGGSGVSGLGSLGGMPTKSLATLSLAQTPDAMAKATSTALSNFDKDRPSLMVNLSGGPYDRVNFTWEGTDTSHVSMVYFYSDSTVAGYAAKRAALATALGRRFDKDGRINWHGAFLSFDEKTTYAQGEPTSGSDKNPHWKEQVEAGWDVIRSVVLGLPVTVSVADKRDWLGGGYTLAALGAVDPGVDVDHSTATMQTAFAEVQVREMAGLDFTVAVNHPWFGEAELDWPNEKDGTLQEMNIRPPPQSSSAFPNQDAIEACVQSIVGGKGERMGEDHLKGTHDTEWKPAGGGALRVYPHMIAIWIKNAFAPKKMDRATYQKILAGLDACGRGK